MGLYSFLLSLFKEGPDNTQQEDPTPSRSLSNVFVPHTTDLMYPATLPCFEKISEGGHSDPRAAVYTMLCLDLQKKTLFFDAKLNALDFGGVEKAYQLLLEKKLIRVPSPGKELAALHTQDELKNFLRKQGLPVNGNKNILAERLIDNGFKFDRRNDHHRLFELTEDGAGMILEHRSDEKDAILLAISALRGSAFYGAISALRDFDSKWGFIHTSGKKHTIFANYHIPFSRFEFMANYPMPELNNSDDFKSALRACLIAGTMTKHKERWQIADLLESVCQEQIQCPDIVDYFRADDPYAGTSDRDLIFSIMQRNVDSDNRYVLEYYISHVKFLSKQSS